MPHQQPFTSTPWKLVKPIGSTLVGKAATLHVTHIKHSEHGSEAVELRMTYKHQGGDSTERMLRVDLAAVPALINFLKRLID
jgi:hypothetical protein